MAAVHNFVKYANDVIRSFIEWPEFYHKDLESYRENQKGNDL